MAIRSHPLCDPILSKPHHCVGSSFARRAQPYVELWWNMSDAFTNKTRAIRQTFPQNFLWTVMFSKRVRVLSRWGHGSRRNAANRTNWLPSPAYRQKFWRENVLSPRTAEICNSFCSFTNDATVWCSSQLHYFRTQMSHKLGPHMTASFNLPNFPSMTGVFSVHTRFLSIMNSSALERFRLFCDLCASVVPKTYDYDYHHWTGVFLICLNLS
jgi:hypothetical protein